MPDNPLANRRAWLVA